MVKWEQRELQEQEAIQALSRNTEENKTYKINFMKNSWIVKYLFRFLLYSIYCFLLINGMSAILDLYISEKSGMILPYMAFVMIVAFLYLITIGSEQLKAFNLIYILKIAMEFIVGAAILLVLIIGVIMVVVYLY